MQMGCFNSEKLLAAERDQTIRRYIDGEECLKLKIATQMVYRVFNV